MGSNLSSLDSTGEATGSLNDTGAGLCFGDDSPDSSGKERGRGKGLDSGRLLQIQEVRQGLCRAVGDFLLPPCTFLM